MFLTHKMATSKRKRTTTDKESNEEQDDDWLTAGFKPEHSSGPFLEESSFATLFPQYREKYLREMWPTVTKVLDNHHIACELNLIEGSMTVRTTRKTFDPIVILKARDFIKLLARSVDVRQAAKIMNDDMHCDIVKIGGFLHNKERFAKRRQRLIGPNSTTLRALELLTDCYIHVQGNTVSCMGDYKGLKVTRRIIEDCMKNVHPMYHIKTLMIKRELGKDPRLKDENWDRFLPKFKKKNVKKKKKPRTEKKDYTPFPPLPTPRKVDLQLESGEYFMSQAQQKVRHVEERRMESKEHSKKRKADRLKEFEPPSEDAHKKKKRRKDESGQNESIMDLAAKIKKKAKQKRKKEAIKTI